MRAPEKNKKVAIIMDGKYLTNLYPIPNIIVPATLTGEQKMVKFDCYFQVAIGTETYWVERTAICDEPEYIKKAWGN